MASTKSTTDSLYLEDFEEPDYFPHHFHPNDYQTNHSHGDLGLSNIGHRFGSSVGDVDEREDVLLGGGAKDDDDMVGMRVQDTNNNNESEKRKNSTTTIHSNEHEMGSVGNNECVWSEGGVVTTTTTTTTATTTTGSSAGGDHIVGSADTKTKHVTVPTGVRREVQIEEMGEEKRMNVEKQDCSGNLVVGGDNDDDDDDVDDREADAAATLTDIELQDMNNAMVGRDIFDPEQELGDQQQGGVGAGVVEREFPSEETGWDWSSLLGGGRNGEGSGESPVCVTELDDLDEPGRLTFKGVQVGLNLSVGMIELMEYGFGDAEDDLKPSTLENPLPLLGKADEDVDLRDEEGMDIDSSPFWRHFYRFSAKLV
jgi:hypothetical protein